MASKEGAGESTAPESRSSSSQLPGDDSTLEAIRRYIVEKLGFYSDDNTESTEKPKVLDEVTLDGIVKFIKDGKCKNILTMAGAGISTSAGIPDFRSPGSGLYHNLQKYDLPDPQAIFEIGFFRRNPQPFFTLAKELFPGSFKPTICHYFIRLLAEKGLLLRHYTQNIDTLERVAGLTSDKIIEAHGTFFTSHCLECHKEFSMEWMREKIFQDNVPSCTECNGVVKPDIVFFGESLPPAFYTKSVSDFPKADLLIVMGSSLAVQPFASLVDKVTSKCPRLLINREKAGHRDRIMTLLGMGGGLDFDSENNSRDVLWLGDCDQGCQLLADKLGWGDELRAMVTEEHKIIEDKVNHCDSKKTQEKSDEGKEAKPEEQDESTESEKTLSAL